MQGMLHLRGGKMQIRWAHRAAETPASGLAVPVSQWAPLVVCAFAMFTPTFYGLLKSGAWSTNEYSHGPLILFASLWLIWRKLRGAPITQSDGRSDVLAWTLMFFSILAYLLGRVLLLEFLDTLSFVVMAAALATLVGGTALLKRLGFPIAFMLFMVPLPSAIVGLISGHLKPWVAATAVDFLGSLNFPIGRGGSTIIIGQYQLLVADACAGMSNLMMLEALGILYLYLVPRKAMVRNVALAALIIPISFFSNVLRVVVLVLITFYFGEAAGEGYMHKFAGLLTFAVALIVMLAADKLLVVAFRSKGALY